MTNYAGTIALNDSLLMDTVTIEDSGLVTAGYVINGDWVYRSNGTMGFAYRRWDDLLNPVNTWPLIPQRLVFVPSIHVKGYNGTLDWASTQPEFTGNIQEYLDMASIERINMKRPVSGFDDMDDDIPF